MMMKTLLLGLVLISSAGQAAADAALFSRSADIRLGRDDYQALAERFLHPDQIRQILSSEAELLNFVLTHHSDQGLWRQAEAAGLDQDPDVAARLLRARQRILIEALMQQVAEQTELPGPELLARLARQRYDGNPEAYRLPEQRQAAHLLLAHKPAWSAASCEQRVTVEDLQARLDQGADFAELAREYSEDAASAADGGRLDVWTTRVDGRFVEPFLKAMFELEAVGDVSGPVKTSYGVHLIQLTGIQPGRLRPFEEVREEIEAQLRREIIHSRQKQRRNAAFPDRDSLDLPGVREVLEQTLEQARPQP